LVSAQIEFNLQLFDLADIHFVVGDVYLCHDFTVAVAKLGVNLRTLLFEKFSENTVFCKNILLDYLKIGFWLLQNRNLLQQEFSKPYRCSSF
jgi:hypothetical protein